MALRAVADITSLMAELVVDLPGCHLFLIPVVFCHCTDDPSGIFVHHRTVEAVHMAASKSPLLPALEPGKDIRMLMGQPGRNRSRGSAQNHLEPSFFGFCYHPVKKRKVILPFCPFH